MAGFEPPLFWGRRWRVAQTPVAGAALGGRPETGFSRWGRNPRLLRALFDPLEAAIPVIKPMSPGARAVFRALLEPCGPGSLYSSHRSRGRTPPFWGRRLVLVQRGSLQ